MNRPTFLCIGAQKAATSWLDHRLRQHPGIWMPPFKEVHYFDHVHLPEVRGWTADHIPKAIARCIGTHLKHRPKKPDLDYLRWLAGLGLGELFNDDWYLRLFDRPEAEGKAIGEITPLYCALPPEGIAHVRELLGPIRLVYIIRDPRKRALSQLRMTLQRRYPKRLLGPTRSEVFEALEHTPIAHRGDYATYIPRWEAVFGEEALLYLPFGLIQREPAEALARVERHFGLAPHTGWNKLEQRVHVSRKVRLPRSVLDPLRETLDEQYAFLERRFDRDFLAQL